MCHDITNANQVALGYLEFIQGKPKEEIDQYISFAMSSIYRVNSLIDNVRKLRGIHPDHIGAMNIRSSMDEAINDAFFLADNIKKSVTINMNISPVYFVRANNLLKDIFYNILEFIMRRINDGGTIDIFVNEKENSYDIIFDDSGPGVKTINRWFAVYDDFSKAPRTGQLGLGMYLVKNVAHRFNGSVFLEDRIKGDINKGNRCILTLKKV
jgi:light-regulated signal transduction histidine kinase (bacteriophytochrome)